MATGGERAAVQFGSVVPHMVAPDVVRTAEHYRDVLGFEIAGYWDGAVAPDERYTLRHGVAIHLLERGANIWTVQELLGHTNVTTLLSTHVLNRGGLGVPSPADRLDPGSAAVFTDQVAGGTLSGDWEVVADRSTSRATFTPSTEAYGTVHRSRRGDSPCPVDRALGRGSPSGLGCIDSSRLGCDALRHSCRTLQQYAS